MAKSSMARELRGITVVLHGAGRRKLHQAGKTALNAEGQSSMARELRGMTVVLHGAGHRKLRQAGKTAVSAEGQK